MIAAAPSPLRALWGLTRPRGAVWVALLPWLGVGFAHWDRALTLQVGAGALVGLSIAWGLLHAGTMWMNGALDQDRGEVLFGEPWPVPPQAVAAAWAALGGAVVVGAVVHPVTGACALGCALLAVLYSHPRTRWKGHPLLGPAVNLLGYGVLSPLAGWWLVGWPTNPRTLAIWAVFLAWILGCYFAGQAFQHDEDRARGYRTLVAVRGPRETVWAAAAALGLAGLGFFGLAAVGWLPRATLFAAPVLGWALVALFGPVDAPGWSARVFGRLLWFGWVALGAVTADYFVADAAGDRPVAGLGTARGLPPDRPALSPDALHRLEHWNAR